jgi:anti-anti-sigma regulatory factor
LADDTPIVIDVSAITRPDGVAVDAIARLELLARRHGRRLLLRNVSPELDALLGFFGLRGVLQVCGEPEKREETFGVEEEVQTGDLTV